MFVFKMRLPSPTLSSSIDRSLRQTEINLSSKSKQDNTNHFLFAKFTL
jgi:hypothetical protein